jgi:hypothetical protein
MQKGICNCLKFGDTKSPIKMLGQIPAERLAMQSLLCLIVLLAVGVYSNTHAEIGPPELLKAKTVYLRDRGNDRKLSDAVRAKVKEWEDGSCVTASRTQTWCWC